MSEYFSGTVARSFDKESDQRILYWDFSKGLDEKLKMQTELLLNEIVKSIKNREERRNNRCGTSKGFKTAFPPGRRIATMLFRSNSLSNKMGNSLLAVRKINHKYIGTGGL